MQSEAVKKLKKHLYDAQLQLNCRNYTSVGAFILEAQRVIESTQSPASAVEFNWIDPHDKTQKQWLPWIGENVMVKFKTGEIHEGWHTGGSWRTYAKGMKKIDNDDISSWAYTPRIIKPESE